MRNGLIGRKLGMTQIFLADGKCIPVTLLQVGPCSVVDKKTTDKHGYNAIQLGFEEVKPSRVDKPLKGIFAKANLPPLRILREFRVEDPHAFEVGQELNISQFGSDQFVDVIGTSVGKGFAGVMKRWGFRGGRASHGAKKIHRSGGAIGQCQTPSRVFKGKKMAGHMGDQRVTVLGLQIAVLDAEKNLMAVKGSVPGAEGSVVLVRDAVKKS